MNSVSMPRRPVSRARAASSATTPSAMRGPYVVRPMSGVALGGSRRLLVGPVPVTVIEAARVVLLGAIAVAGHADAVEDVQQPHRQARADEQAAALQPGLAEAAGDRHGDA